MSRLAPIYTALLGLGVILAGEPALTAMYRCTDASGASVFSDSTAQLRNCSPMNLASPVPPAGGTAPARFPERSDVPKMAPRMELPPAAATVPIESPEMQEPTPEAAPALPVGGNPGPSSDVAAQDSQPCTRGVNALNPFNQNPCPPSETPDGAQAETTPTQSRGGMFK
ncbi:MAG: DUF4124 domain-containing protein [Anaerolineales bacterium]